MSGRWVALTGALALALLPVLAGCGKAASKPDEAASTPTTGATATPGTQAVKKCQAQWHDVGESVIGLDQDPDPSSLASRWTTVIATVDYYETSPSLQGCQAAVEAQVRAITALREFSDRLRPYDMAYQLEHVQAAVDLYLHDPVPAPVRGANGKRVQAPSHDDVAAAIQKLTVNADAANAELQPGWEHLATVTLGDDAAVTAALGDLDALAQAGKHWRTCQRALQVIVAATRAQEGLLGKPEESTATPTG
jgi:hypothetical protein